MLELYSLMLALCGQPQLKMCYVDAISCYKVKGQMRCNADIVLRTQKKKTKKKVSFAVFNKTS